MHLLNNYMLDSLSLPAKLIIDAYLNLCVGNVTCSAPYVNNRTSGIRGGLAVHVGKGTPKEITEEIELLAKKKHINLVDFNEQQAKKFLVDHKIGIECSGFTYHLLDAEVKARTGKPLASFINFPFIKNPLRKLLARHNPVTRTGTKSFAHNANSTEIAIANVCAGDMIIMLGYGAKNDRDHVAVVEHVEKDMNTIIVHYVHSLAWKIDGKYNHGVRRGTIAISDQGKPLTHAVWEEQAKTGAQNQTLQNAKTATYLGIRRLHALSTP